MLPIFSIFLLLLIPVVLGAIYFWRPRFPYSWLIATLFTLLSWIGLLVSYNQIPQKIQLINWQTTGLLPFSPNLIFDDISWSYGLVLVTLLIAYLLTSTVQSQDVATDSQPMADNPWLVWGSPLVAVGLGVAAMFAGDLIALIIIWASLDIFELFLRLFTSTNTNDVNPIIVSFGFRIAGIFPIIWVIASSGIPDFPSPQGQIDNRISTLILVGAILRLGVIPITLPLDKSVNNRTKLTRILRFIPAASVLMLLTRLTGILSAQDNLVLISSVLLVAIISSLIWSIRNTRHSSQPYWLLTMAAILIPASLFTQPSVSLSIGIAMLLTGGLFYFSSIMDRRLIPLGFLGLLGITMLPFTAGWYGVRLYLSDISNFIYIFILPQAILLAGYTNWILTGRKSTANQDRSIWVIYYLGLFLLPFVQYIIAYWVLYKSDALGLAPPSIIESWPAFVACLVAGILVYILRRVLEYKIPSMNSNNIERVRNSIGAIPGIIFRTLSLGISFLDQLIEGRGSILWTILFLTLVISILSNIGD